MEATTQKIGITVIHENDLHNLEALKRVGEWNNDFKIYADAVNTLFYYHIQDHIDTPYLTSEDVYLIKQVVDFFNELKTE